MQVRGTVTDWNIAKAAYRRAEEQMRSFNLREKAGPRRLSLLKCQVCRKQLPIGNRTGRHARCKAEG